MEEEENLNTAPCWLVLAAQNGQLTLPPSSCLCPTCLPTQGQGVWSCWLYSRILYVSYILGSFQDWDFWGGSRVGISKCATRPQLRVMKYGVTIRGDTTIS